MRLPTDTERIVIAGHTGSGKTLEALCHLSLRSIDARPWIILDQKGDDLVARCPVSGPLTLTDPLPEEPGLYVVRAEIDDERRRGPVEEFLLRVYERGGIGVMIDEGGMLGMHNRGLRALLTLGRSRSCPLIFLTQRPRNIDTYALSESEYLQFFNLPHPDDRDRIARFVPPDRLDFDLLREAGQYHSFYYDVRNDDLEIVAPCPEFTVVYDRLLTRLPRVVDDPAMVPPMRVRI
jgi:hypothetical protein